MFLAGKFFRYIFSFLLLSILPFFILIRGALYFYELNIGGYTSLLVASILAGLLIITYLILIDRWLSEKVLVALKFKVTLVILLMIGLNVYCLHFYSQKNLKHNHLRGEFTSLHPLLRLSVSIVTLSDKKLLVTSIKRRPSDYKKMGLDPVSNSLHFKQRDGYVHAVDIRTNSRWFFRNWFNKTMFSLLGFITLRHSGTADHLHVSLPIIR